MTESMLLAMGATSVMFGLAVFLLAGASKIWRDW